MAERFAGAESVVSPSVIAATVDAPAEDPLVTALFGPAGQRDDGEFRLHSLSFAPGAENEPIVGGYLGVWRVVAGRIVLEQPQSKSLRALAFLALALVTLVSIKLSGPAWARLIGLLRARIG